MGFLRDGDLRLSPQGASVGRLNLRREHLWYMQKSWIPAAGAPSQIPFPKSAAKYPDDKGGLDSSHGNWCGRETSLNALSA